MDQKLTTYSKIESSTLEQGDGGESRGSGESKPANREVPGGTVRRRGGGGDVGRRGYGGRRWWGGCRGRRRVGGSGGGGGRDLRSGGRSGGPGAGGGGGGGDEEEGEEGGGESGGGGHCLSVGKGVGLKKGWRVLWFGGRYIERGEGGRRFRLFVRYGEGRFGRE